MKGNGAITGPITFLSPTAELTWNINGTLGANLTLAGGTLILDNDMRCVGGVELIGPGIVDLGSNKMRMGTQDIEWDSDICWDGTNGMLSLQSHVSLTSTWTFNNSCTIKGNGHVLDLCDTGKIEIIDGATLTFRDLFLRNVRGSNIKCLGDNSTVVLDKVTWIQSDDYTFDTGRMRFVDTVDVVGGHTFFYESNQTSTVQQKSRLHISDHVNFSIGKKQQEGAVESLVFEDRTATLLLDNCTLSVTGSGARFTKGRLLYKNEVTLDVNSTTTNNGFIIGDGTAAGDMTFEVRPGATIIFQQGNFMFDDTTGNAIKSVSKSSKAVRKAASHFYVNQNMVLSALSFEVELGSTLEVAAGKTLSYEGVQALTPMGEFDITGIRYNDVANLLGGNHTIFLTKGDLPLATLVSGVGNTIQGNGKVTGPVTFLASSAELTWDAQGILGGDLTLNGGAITLGNDLLLASATYINGPGTVHMASKQVSFGAQSLTCNMPLYWDGSDATIKLRADLALSSAWTFSGVTEFNGDGHTLNLNGGELIIEDGSHLTIKNMHITGISSNNIRCLDEGGLLTLKNVHWDQTGDYTFAAGAMRIEKKVKMHGNDFVFAYQSNMTSTIVSNATWKLDEGITFSYDPAIVAAKNLLTFQDNTATLVLNGATLHTTVTGLELQHGNLLIERDSFISSEIEYKQDEQIIDEGITFGTALASSDDCVVTILSGVVLHVTQGSLNYKNVASTSWDMISDRSLLRMMTGTTLRLYETLDSGVGIVSFAPNTILARATGKKIMGSTDIAGGLLLKNL